MAVDTMRLFGVPQARYDHLMDCNTRFIAACDKSHLEPVNVFPPLPEKSLEELDLIRNISVTLQQQKADYLKLAEQQKQAAEEAMKNKEIEQKAAVEEESKEEKEEKEAEE